MTKTSQPPAVNLPEIEPFQEFFVDGNGDRWDVARLIDAAEDLPVFNAPLAAFDLSSEIWRGADIYTLARHVQKCMYANLDHPIIIAWDGSIADGRHRLIKALAEGRTHIKAKRMQWRPQPSAVAAHND